MTSQEAHIAPLAQALGRIPAGLFLVTTKDEAGQHLGFVGSFIQQVGFEPPTVCVSIGSNRPHLDAVRNSGGFAISILDPESQSLMGTFFKKRPEGTSPFDEMRTKDAGHGLVFPDALAWIDCEFTGEHDAGDHVVVFGKVRSGELQREGESSTHLRKNGLGY